MRNDLLSAVILCSCAIGCQPQATPPGTAPVNAASGTERRVGNASSSDIGAAKSGNPPLKSIPVEPPPTVELSVADKQRALLEQLIDATHEYTLMLRRAIDVQSATDWAHEIQTTKARTDRIRKSLVDLGPIPPTQNAARTRLGKELNDRLGELNVERSRLEGQPELDAIIRAAVPAATPATATEAATVPTNSGQSPTP